ncbi:PDZ domain-containing protein, partial [Candidatus Sumerlaeota bacterium]|nr:PDZ domain-containing protein [Candidatus Sumerlaeota bacterium]
MTSEPAPRSSRFMTLRRVLLGSALIGFLVRAVALLPAQESSALRGYLGIHARSNSNVLDESNALEGITVTGVVENSPAEAAGVRVGDILLQAGGVDLTDPAQLLFLADSLPVGSGIRLRLERDRRVREVEVRTVARLEPSDAGRAGETRSWIENKLLGIEFGAVDSELAERLGLSSFEAIQIFRIARKSPLRDAGIQAGSVVRQIDDEKIYSPQGFLDYL